MSDDDHRRLAKLAERELKTSPESLTWQTPEGIAVKPLYTADDLQGMDHLGSMPGVAPFMRGPRATMYAGRPWTIRQYAGFSTARGVQRLLPQGAGGRAEGPVASPSISPPTAATTATIRASSAMSARPAWRSTCVEDMKILFDGIPLDEMSRVDDHERRGDPGPRHASSSPARSRALPATSSSGTIQNDILKEFMVRNTYIYPPEPSMRIVARHHRLHGAARCRSSTRSRSPATTCRRPARRWCRSSPSRSPTAREYVRAALAQGPGRRRLRRPALASSSPSA